MTTTKVPEPNMMPPAPPDDTLELTGNPARDLAHSFNVRVIVFLALHIPLVFLLEAYPWVSTIHALLILAYGLRAALLAKSSQVLYAVAYLAGGEVLWRMTRACALGVRQVCDGGHCRRGNHHGMEPGAWRASYPKSLALILAIGSLTGRSEYLVAD
ncbi:MAG: hypothetical protein R3C44_12085 [Chloroflexota bacterium]